MVVVTANCPTCGSIVGVHTACGKEKPDDSTWARPVMACECGNAMFGATVTFSG